ncbi:MAG: protease inhibitor I42 family protein [Candidatus Binataceae bacterium]
MTRPTVRSVVTVSTIVVLATALGLAASTAQTAGPSARPSAAATAGPAGAAAAIPEIEHTVTVTDSQNGKMIMVAKSDTLIVSLPITTGTGYSWLISSFDPTQLKVIGKPEIKKTTAAKPGAAAQQVFRFQPLMSGSGALEIDYVRPFEKSFRPARVFTITVTVR